MGVASSVGVASPTAPGNGSFGWRPIATRLLSVRGGG